MEKRIQKLFDEDSKFPGISVGILQHAQQSVFCYGYTSYEKKDPVNEELPFHLCSISKWITALAVMILCEKGMLSLDRNVNDYLEHWKMRDMSGHEVSCVTLRHILCHTSGVVDGENSFTGYRVKMGQISAFDMLEGNCLYNTRPTRMEHQSGDVFEYSDAGYVIVQLIIETVMKQDFEQVINELIFSPLRMNNTFIGTQKNFDAKDYLPVGYNEKGEANDVRQVICPDFACAGVWSTPSDILILANEFIDSMHNRGRLLPKNYIMQMLVPQNNKFGWAGMGTFFERGHGFVSKGWGEDAQSMLFVDYETEFACIVMGNCDPGVDQDNSLIGKIVSEIETKTNSNKKES